MTQTLTHDIARHTVAVEKTTAWIGAQEAAQGVAGMAADDFRYPSNLVRARDRLAELETILDGLLKRVVDEYVPSPPAWSTGPAGRWVLQLENAGWRAPEIADALMLVRSDIESVVETLQQNRHFGIAQEPEDAAMTRRVRFERRSDPAGDRLEVVTLRDTSIGFVPAEYAPTILEALAAPKNVRAFIWKTPSLHGHFWLLVRIEGGGKRSFLGLQLEGKWGFEYPRTGADVVAEERTVEVEAWIAKPAEPARKSRRGAPDPITDADRATTIVMRAMKAVGRPGVPLPILRVVAAELTDRPDGAEAEVTMFDGLSARFECERIGSDQDAWKTRWSRMEGGDIELVDGTWQRAVATATL